MESFRKGLKRRTQLYGALCGLVPACTLLLNWWTGRVSENGSDFVAGFTHGMGFGLLVLLLAFSVRQIVMAQKAMRDEATLKKMYIQETDERTLFIQNKVGGAGLRLVLLLLVFASMVASYFSATVCFTLAAAAVGISLVLLGFKLYYRNKY